MLKSWYILLVKSSWLVYVNWHKFSSGNSSRDSKGLYNVYSLWQYNSTSKIYYKGKMRHNDYVKIFNKYYSDARIWKQSKHRKIGEDRLYQGAAGEQDTLVLHQILSSCIIQWTFVYYIRHTSYNTYNMYIHRTLNICLLVGWFEQQMFEVKFFKQDLVQSLRSEDPGVSGCPEKRGGRASPQHLTFQPEGPDPHSHLLATIITRALYPSFRKRDPPCTCRRGTKCKQASPCSPSFPLSS